MNKLDGNIQLKVQALACQTDPIWIYAVLYQASSQIESRSRDAPVPYRCQDQNQVSLDIRPLFLTIWGCWTSR